MKTIYEIWTETPIDHLVMIVVIPLGVIYAVWALLFDPDKEKEIESKQKIEYYVEPPRASFLNPAIISLFIVTLVIVTLLIFYLIDNAGAI